MIDSSFNCFNMSCRPMKIILVNLNDHFNAEIIQWKLLMISCTTSIGANVSAQFLKH